MTSKHTKLLRKAKQENKIFIIEETVQLLFYYYVRGRKGLGISHEGLYLFPGGKSKSTYNEL